MPEQDIKMVEAMEKYGGSFVKALAACLRHADNSNYAKLRDAFPNYFKTYKAMADNKS